VAGDWLSLPALTGCISSGAGATVSAPAGVYWNIPGGGKSGIRMDYTLQGGASGYTNLDWPTDDSNFTYSFNGDGGQVLELGTPLTFSGILATSGGDAPTSWSWQFIGEQAMDAVEFLAAQSGASIPGQTLTAMQEFVFIIHEWGPGSPQFRLIGSAINGGGTAQSTGRLTISA